MGEELLFFDPLTWQTHVLNRTAADIVGTLSTGSATSAEAIADSIAPGDEAFRQEVESLLLRLFELGLLERAHED